MKKKVYTKCEVRKILKIIRIILITSKTNKKIITSMIFGDSNIM